MKFLQRNYFMVGCCYNLLQPKEWGSLKDKLFCLAADFFFGGGGGGGGAQVGK